MPRTRQLLQLLQIAGILCLYQAFSNLGALLPHRVLSLQSSGIDWPFIEKKLPWSTVPDQIVIDSVLQPDIALDSDVLVKESLPLLLRERNGWCPYSERVWLALEVLNIDYHTILIDNMGRGRPDWYDGSTPQMKFPNDDRVKGESLDLIKTVDAYAQQCSSPSPIQLYPSGLEKQVQGRIDDFTRTFPRNTRPSSRGAFLSSNYGELLSKAEFEKVLVATDALLSQNEESAYFIGKEITAVDIVWAPFLERYAIQLPLLYTDLDPRDAVKYPHLSAWYDSLEINIPCYSSRISGDRESWTKVLKQQGYGNAGFVPNTIPSFAESTATDLSNEDKKSMQRLKRRENMKRIAHQFYSLHRSYIAPTPELEAASRITRNRHAIVQDMLHNPVDKNSSDTKEVDEKEVEKMLQALILELIEVNDEKADKMALLDVGINSSTNDDDSSGDVSNDGGNDIHEEKESQRKERKQRALYAACYMDDRVCVPRDMGVLTANSIRNLKHSLQMELDSKEL